MAEVETATPGGTAFVPEKLEGEELFEAVRDQINYYFSQENLSKDSFMISKMDEEKFVPIDLIANFRKIKNLTEDRTIILSAMQQCSNLIIDSEETKIRPKDPIVPVASKSERNTLILRDIAADTPKADIEKIFEEDESCGKVVSIRSDIGDTWFVTFETEDECMDTAMHLSNKQFQGKPIRCRVKAANTPRRSTAGRESGQFANGAPRAGSANFYPMGYNGNPYMNGQYGYAMYNPNYNQHWQGYGGQMPPYGDSRKPPRNKKAMGAGRGDASPAGAADGQWEEGQGRGKRQPRESAQKDENWKQTRGRKQGGAREKREQGGRGNGQKAVAAAPAPQPQPQLEDPGDFPALPGKADPVEGYGKAPYKKYDRETMASAIAALIKKGVKKPEGMLDDFSIILLKEPLADSQLLEPMPVIYPASPSPLLAAQTVHSSQVPFLDLNSYGNPYLPPDKAMSFSAAAELPAQAAATSNSSSKSSTTTTSKAKAAPAGGERKKSSRKSTQKNGGKAPAGEANGNRRNRGSNKYATKPTKPAAAAAAPTKAAPAQSGGEKAPLSPSKMSYAEMARKAAEKRAAETASK